MCKDNYKILFFGLGSIGNRLARLIKDNFDYDLYAFRSSKNGKNNAGIEEIYNNSDISRISPDIAFITNPTHLHLKTAIQSASQGMHLFIEKPLSNNLEGYNLLLNEVRSKKLMTYVGCHLRFDPIIKHLKDAIKALKITYGRIRCSSYLPEWRPGRDYRESYSSKKEMGGGVILDLIHEPDYCHYLFGPIDKVTGTAGKLSNLEIDSEDYADMTAIHGSGFISHIHLDYYARKSARKIELFGDDIYIEADLLERRITTVTRGGHEKTDFNGVERDYPYKMELEYFFDCLHKNITPMNNIEEHIKVLKPVIHFKASLGL